MSEITVEKVKKRERGTYYKNSDFSYPIDPFAIINDLGIHHAFRNLDRIEGLLLTDTDGTGVKLIVINSLIVPPLIIDCAEINNIKQ